MMMSASGMAAVLDAGVLALALAARVVARLLRVCPPARALGVIVVRAAQVLGEVVEALRRLVADRVGALFVAHGRPLPSERVALPPPVGLDVALVARDHISRGVDRDEPQRLVAGVDDLVWDVGRDE